MFNSTSARPSRRKRGFTLIELLVVVLILAILMAVALPLYLSAVADSQRKTCRANMQTIANAVAASRVRQNTPDYTSFTGNVSTTNEPDLQNVPSCPNNGAYTIVMTGSPSGAAFSVSCSGSSGGTAHGTFQPGVDHN